MCTQQPCAHLQTAERPRPTPALVLDNLPLIFVTFGNNAYADFMLNWIKSVQEVGADMLVGAFDEKTAEMCRWPFRTLFWRLGPALRKSHETLSVMECTRWPT